MTDDRFRILVTGSRNWNDPLTVLSVLRSVVEENAPGPFTLVHGGARGADLMASWAAGELFQDGHQIDIEEYLPDWANYQNRAGIIRNQVMVDKGANLCVAFIRDSSAGASHCASAAEAAGIPVRRVTA